MKKIGLSYTVSDFDVKFKCVKSYFIKLNLRLPLCLSLSASSGHQPLLCVPVIQHHPVDD